MNQRAYLPFVSVIIPTYNRSNQLTKSLESLARQTYSVELIEVVVVDDGSRESYDCVTERSWPFTTQYYRQDNQGEIVARNEAVRISQGGFLVFLDDDVVVEPAYIEFLVLEHLTYPQAVLVGTIYPKLDLNATVFQRVMAAQFRFPRAGEVTFTECVSNVLAVGRSVYQAVGGMRPLGDGGRNIWGGIDFAYRARLAGYGTRRCAQAIAYHDDYALKDLAIYCNRMYYVARLAVLLFQRYPNIQSLVPMFHDKTPIAWRQDPPHLIARKLARHVVSSRPALWGMEQIVSVLEQRCPSPTLLRSLYRWIIGDYIFRGCREGLREYGPVEGRR